MRLILEVLRYITFSKSQSISPYSYVFTPLTHWGRVNMDAISQMTFSNAFSWMKMLEFRLKFRWSLFLRVQFNIFQHWFRYWLGADQATSHYLNQWCITDAYMRHSPSVKYRLYDFVVCNVSVISLHEEEKWIILVLLQYPRECFSNFTTAWCLYNTDNFHQNLH